MRECLKKRRKCFVSYQYETRNGYGFGNIDIEITGKIKTIENVREIEKCISEKIGSSNVIVFSWKPLKG